jgi:2'-5' RNA ligase
LWPDPAARAALAELAGALQKQCGGKPVQERNIHLTLVFLGAVHEDRVSSLQQMAAAIRGLPIEFILDTAEYWRRNRLVCAGARHCPQALRDLHARLDEGAGGLGMQTEARDFVPHITLLRKAERPPVQQAFGGIAWHASDFVLVSSVLSRAGATYETIGRWVLSDRTDHLDARVHPAR